jgi:hypothetical protein
MNIDNNEFFEDLAMLNSVFHLRASNWRELSFNANVIVCGLNKSPKGKWLPVLKRLIEKGLVVREAYEYMLTMPGREEYVKHVEQLRNCLSRVDGFFFA